MLKYAGLFLGLLSAQSALACDPDYTNCTPERQQHEADMEGISARQKADRDEYNAYVERTNPVLVTSPSGTYTVYPSGDGRSAQVYGPAKW